jgi:hypothetical protein
MTYYNQQFTEACYCGHIDIAKRLAHDHHIDHFSYKFGFVGACNNGHIEIAKWLVQDHQVDIHANDEYIFQTACSYGHIEIAKWLVQNHQVDVQADDNLAFKWAHERRQNQIIDWLVDEYRYSESPYYYHNETGYILNHEPIKGWQSCTILDCPIIYRGELDEQSVIAYMETLKRPKSARS